MQRLLQTFAAVFVFAGILTGCVVALLLVLALVRFPPLLFALVLACWLYQKLRRQTQR